MPNDICFHPGELVRLRSGGPDMTVNYVRAGNQHVDCSWFDSTLSPEPFYATFQSNTLTLRKALPIPGDLDEQLRAGQVVRLRSGGPAMTMEYYSRDNGSEQEVSCIWFDENSHKLSSSLFHLHGLVIEEDQQRIEKRALAETMEQTE